MRSGAGGGRSCGNRPLVTPAPHGGKTTPDLFAHLAASALWRSCPLRVTDTRWLVSEGTRPLMIRPGAGTDVPQAVNPRAPTCPPTRRPAPDLAESMRLSTQGTSIMKRPTEAWRSYAAGSEVDHFAKFCKEHLVQSEDRWEGKPLSLEPWQRRMMGEALAFDEDGLPTSRSVVIVAPRKNGRRQSSRLSPSTGCSRRPVVPRSSSQPLRTGSPAVSSTRPRGSSVARRRSRALYVSATTRARSCARTTWASSTDSRATRSGSTGTTHARRLQRARAVVDLPRLPGRLSDVR